MNVIVVIGCVLTVVNARGTPPRISVPQGNSWPLTTEYVRRGNAKMFHCEADADPPARYYWTVNGTRLPNDRESKLTFDEHTGTLTAGGSFDQDESGEYQCFAQNAHGTAMTPILNILATVADPFKGQASGAGELVEVYVSNYVMLECKNIPPSVPKWKFFWEKGIMVNEKLQSSPITEKDRMVIDLNGNLHILWAVEDDKNYRYACSTLNEIMLVEVRNTETIRLNVKDGSFTNRPPKLEFSQDVVVYAGEDARLMCIFSYCPETGDQFYINWLYEGRVVGNGTELVLKNVRYPEPDNTQEGEYKCEAFLRRRGGSPSQATGKVNLKIVAPPRFIKAPETKSVPVEKDAVFNCEAHSHNSFAKPVVWLINTIPLLGCPPRFFECATKYENGSSQCVEEKKVCDTFPHCTDGTDEDKCPGSCPESYKRCGEECIPNASPCQELQCDYPGFMCHNKKACIPKEKVCNRDEDCSDGSDEYFCPGQGDIQRNRYVINSQRTQLTVPMINLTDSMCVQCMVTNDYGTLIGDACLTVINKITVSRGPNSTYFVEPGTLLDITVEATTDRLWQNQMSFEWFWYEKVNDKKTGDMIEVPVKLPPEGRLGRYFRVGLRGKNMVIQFPEVGDDDTDAYNIYNHMKDSVYSVVIKHKYDRVELNFTIYGVEIVKPTGAPVVEAASTNLWFIALILAILILFIVVALIVCYMYRNRGGTYLLGKKEQQAGHDPAQELKDSGFHDVGRVDDEYDDDKPRGDEASLSESVKPYESDDDPTEEYGGDFDVSKFNEDGSFIGLYGDKKSKYAKEATV